MWDASVNWFTGTESAAIDKGLYDDAEFFGDETAWDRWLFL